MAIATLSSKSQLVLPSAIRRRLGIHPGDRLIIEAEGDTVVIRKVVASDVEHLAAYRSPRWRDYEAELEASRAQWD